MTPVELVNSVNGGRTVMTSIERDGPLFVVDFDYRSDDGPRLCGPFRTRTSAQEWAEAQPIPMAEWSVTKLWIPVLENGSSTGSDRAVSVPSPDGHNSRESGS